MDNLKDPMVGEIKMKRINIFFLGIILSSVFGCSQHENMLEEIITDKEVHTIIATIEDLDFSDGTRATFNASNLSMVWDDEDEVGIFPNQGGYQLGFSLNGQGGQAVAMFSGGGWAVRTDAAYSSYYPFNFDLRHGLSIPVDFTGQTQAANGNVEHVGNYTFCATLPSSAENGAISFNFLRVCGTIWFVITVPDPGTYNKISLVTDSNLFTVAGTYNLLNAQTEGDLIISPTKTSNKISLALNSISVTADNLVINAYMTSAPFDLTGHPLHVEVEKNDGTIYKSTSTINPILVRNGAKRIATTVTAVSSIGDWEDGDHIGGNI